MGQVELSSNVEKLVCDGKKIGFKIKINGEYLKTNNGLDRYFSNLEFGKAIAYFKGAKSGRDFEIDFCCYGNVVPFDYIQKLNGHYEFFGADENENITRYIIEEVSVIEYSHFGYISFDNGYNERTDKEFGIKRARILKKIMLQSIEKLSLKYGVVSNILVYDKGITIEFSNTTAKLDIMANSGLMDVNQWRKNVKSTDPEYSRCFPYIKSVDKFVTFYSFISKELHEPSKSKNSKVPIVKQFRDLLMEDLQNNWDTYNRNKNEKCQMKPELIPVLYKTINKIMSERRS